MYNNKNNNNNNHKNTNSQRILIVTSSQSGWLYIFHDNIHFPNYLTNYRHSVSDNMINTPKIEKGKEW